jgi:hypothetical protein
MAEKLQSLQAMDEARIYLWSVVDSLSDTVEIYPGWNKRDFLAHIAGWEARVFDAFRDHLAGAPLKTYPYDNLKDTDGANAGFVAERQSMTIESARLECEIYRFAIREMLLEIPAENYDNVFPFPWGQMTAARFVQDAIDHEREHADEILQMKQEGRL